MSPPDYLTVDIESLPAIDTDPADTVCKLPKEPERPALREVAANITKDTTKAAHKLKHAERFAAESLTYEADRLTWAAECIATRQEKWRQTSLHPLKARVLCIGWAFGDEPTQTLYANYHNIPDLTPEACDVVESFLLKRYATKLSKHGRPHTWVGHRVGWDLTVLMFRAAKYGITLPLPEPRRYTQQILDTCARSQPWVPWDGASLDAIAKYLGRPGKPDGVDGSKVYGLWLAGEHDTIRSYCADDVDDARAIAGLLP